MFDVANSPGADGFDLCDWSAATVLDAPLVDDQSLRAVVLRLADHQWQWSLSSIEGESGALISTGVERTADAARRRAASEITKCLENALA
jgi:hypothetical protein